MRVDCQAVSREHFLRLRARIIRNILVDYVSARKAEERPPAKDHGGSAPTTRDWTKAKALLQRMMEWD